MLFACLLPAILAANANAAVTHLEARDVSAAFTKGAALAQGDTYKVDASRRDAPGEVEVHEKDTDIFYVLDGTATFVTGGTLQDGRQTAPFEIRGTKLVGGDVRTLAKGDVIVVPKGTPHWFRDVKGPITYFVVKSR